jgi:hypothetical protein
MAEPILDAFILFNEREEAVVKIVDQLKSQGISTYFWRRDVEPGEAWEELETRRLREARVVLVFLGDAGWGPNHLRITQEARRLEKRMVPLLIGSPPGEAFLEAGGLFRDQRYLDMRRPESLEILVDSIRQRPSSALIDRVVGALVDGSEGDRADVLNQIETSSRIDRPALAARLRAEIRERFAPQAENRFASAFRDPKKISSIRSWMLSALIRVDIEGEDSRDLILRSLNPTLEPDRNVRFWTLSGLYVRRASYLASAVDMAVSDDVPEVAALARAIQSPDSNNVLGEFKDKLYSPDFETAWRILRVLRIVPIPDLVDDVCEQLGRTASGTALTYDALYALSNPIMAHAAAVKALPAPRAVALVLAESRNADRNSIRNFTGLLAAFDESKMDALLGEAEEVPGTADVVRLIRRYLAQARRRDDDNDLFVAGYASDAIDIRNDPLGVQEDVQTLTAVMMAQEVKPPLAIGLFGDWGTGKSYFMESMQAAAQDLAKRAASSRSSRFCSSIVPIRFNAWHYVDTNLWATLVSTILEKLSAFVTPRPTPEEEQAALLAELNSAKVAASEAEAEKQRAKTLIDENEKELQRLQLERQQKEVRLRDLRMPDLKTLLPEDQKQGLENLLKQLGVPAALNSVADLSQVVAEGYTVRGRLAAVAVSVLNGKNGKLLLILGSLVLVIIPLGSYLANRYLELDRLFVAGSALVTQVSAVVGGAAVALRKAFHLARTNLEKVEDAKRRVDELIAEKRQNPTQEEIQLQEEIATLKAREQEASSRLSAAAARVLDLEERLRNLKEGRSLSRFLAERTRSEDYRKHLGLVSTIRQDFESLAERLASARAEPVDGLRPVDRIILFIDDLDRCPAPKVMDVLQAVHLLLAYPLFVVVVGVDPRWLLHSLGTTYSAFEGDGTRYGVDADLWRATPQNYLEKIFQIPFNLSRMSDAGYGRLMQRLLSPEVVAEARITEVPPTDIRLPDDRKTPVEPPPDPPQPVQRDQDNKGGTQLAEPEPQAFMIQEEALVIRSWETDFAARLFALIPTPRAAKRFSNTYRILKARVGRDLLAQFEGTEQLPGEFQVPMLLLGILIGAPKAAATLFPELLRRASNGDDPTQVLKRPNEPAFAGLEKDIRPIVTDEGFPCGADIYLEWLPRVSRFSFEVGRTVPAVAQAPTKSAATTPPN